MQIVIKGTVMRKGQKLGPNPTITTDAATGARLIAAGVGRAATDSPASPPPAQKPKGDTLSQAIAEAMKRLDPEDDFTKDGAPNLKALSKVLGYEVSGAERAAALDAIKQGALTLE